PQSTDCFSESPSIRATSPPVLNVLLRPSRRANRFDSNLLCPISLSLPLDRISPIIPLMRRIHFHSGKHHLPNRCVCFVHAAHQCVKWPKVLELGQRWFSVPIVPPFPPVTTRSGESNLPRPLSPSLPLRP